MQLSNCSPAAFYLLCYRMRMEVLSCCTRIVSQKKAPLHLVCDMCSRRFDNLQYKRKYSYPVGHPRLECEKTDIKPKLCGHCFTIVKCQLKKPDGSTLVQKQQQKSDFSFISQDQENTQVKPLTGSPKGLNVFAPRISAEFSVVLQGKSSQEKYPVNGVLPDTVIWLLSEHMSCLLAVVDIFCARKLADLCRIGLYCNVINAKNAWTLVYGKK